MVGKICLNMKLTIDFSLHFTPKTSLFYAFTLSFTLLNFFALWLLHFFKNVRSFSYSLTSQISKFTIGLETKFIVLHKEFHLVYSHYFGIDCI